MKILKLNKLLFYKKFNQFLLKFKNKKNYLKVKQVLNHKVLFENHFGLITQNQKNKRKDYQKISLIYPKDLNLIWWKKMILLFYNKKLNFQLMLKHKNQNQKNLFKILKREIIKVCFFIKIKLLNKIKKVKFFNKIINNNSKIILNKL